MGAGFEAYEAGAASLQMLALQKAFPSRRPQLRTATVLFGPGLPSGQ